MEAIDIENQGAYWGLGFRVEGLGDIVYIGVIGCITGLYWDNGKQNGTYYLGFRTSAQTFH